MAANLNHLILQKAQIPNPIFRFIKATLIAVLIFLICSPLLHAKISTPQQSSKKSYTIMLYLNGDNNLTHEVLYAIDMLETVGSSNDINILALVDGRPGSDHRYGNKWDGSKLLYITPDTQIGAINSVILQDLGEQNLGIPETLESFLKKCLEYPAERYIFCTFTHGRGIIDTKTLETPKQHKSLAISVDETDGTYMTLQQFRHAIQRGLDGKKFDTMVFFTCLANMVEVGYALKDLTEYIIASEDEIRIVNNPPGSFQIRGIKFEEPLKAIRANPQLSMYDFGKVTIDTFIDQYTHDVDQTDINGQHFACRYSASMALIQCRALEQLTVYLDSFATYICQRLQLPNDADRLLIEIRFALSATQRYPSFLNLEYYDLQDFLEKLAVKTQDRYLKALCLEIIRFLKNKVIVYERHTEDSASNGLSIFFSNFLIPENIYETHQKMYRKSQFSKDTQWDEMIEMIRAQMLSRQ